MIVGFLVHEVWVVRVLISYLMSSTSLLGFIVDRIHGTLQFGGCGCNGKQNVLIFMSDKGGGRRAYTEASNGL